MAELDELLQDAITAELAGRVHVALPARVVSYDQAKQTANVQPILRGRFRAEDGTVTSYQLPQIVNVPVAFPQGGGFSITWPLAQGDVVQLVINERSLDEWKGANGADVAPADPRRFDLTDAVAVAGVRSPSGALLEVATGKMVIAGSEILLGDKTATDWVALSSLVETELNTQRTAVVGHGHPSPFGPIGVPLTAATWPVIGDVSATKVKAK